MINDLFGLHVTEAGEIEIEIGPAFTDDDADLLVASAHAVSGALDRIPGQADSCG